MSGDEKESGPKAFQFASKFCFPRLSGSEGDRQAQETAKNIFRELGLSPLEDEFPANYLLMNFFARIALMPFGVFLIAGAVFYRARMPDPALLSFLLALIVGLGFALYCQASPKISGWGKKFVSKNIFAKFGPENPGKEIVLVAHCDSKSQTFPIWVRILTYYVAGILSILTVLFGFYVVLEFTNLPPYQLAGEIPGGSFGFKVYDEFANKSIHLIWFWIIFCVGLLDFLPIFNRVGNKSPGAMDNASACGVVLELARFFKANPLSKTRLWVVLTGAEELGLVGARAFVEKHAAELDPAKTFVINLDILGADDMICALNRLGLPGKMTDAGMNKMIKEISERHSLKFHLIKASLGFSTDAQPFLKKGYRTVSLGSISRSVHTSKDTADKLDRKNLGDYATVIREVVLALDQN
jgi:hypothetical protein